MCKQEEEGLLSQHLSCAEPCVRARMPHTEREREQEREEWQEKGVEYYPIPEGMSPL